MATALVDAVSPSSRARNQAGQFSRHDEGLPREVGGHPEALQATEEMCAYCFGAWFELFEGGHVPCHV